MLMLGAGRIAACVYLAKAGFTGGAIAAIFFCAAPIAFILKTAQNRLTQSIFTSIYEYLVY
jgi:hypothetical protein